jgi:hypothetical protein
LCRDAADDGQQGDDPATGCPDRAGRALGVRTGDDDVVPLRGGGPRGGRDRKADDR